VTGRLADPAGSGVRGTVQVLGVPAAELPVDESGAFTVRLRPGRHRARVDAPGFLSQLVRLEVGGDGRLGGSGPLDAAVTAETDRLDVTLRPRPPSPRVVFADGVGRFTVPFPLAADPTELAPEARALLDELVDALLRLPEARRVRVECHWDRSVSEEEAQRLTEMKAQAVVRYLADRGLPREQLEAAGLGRSRPLAGQPRARQRRLEIHELLP
jgi:hypothetical protein